MSYRERENLPEPAAFPYIPFDEQLVYVNRQLLRKADVARQPSVICGSCHIAQRVNCRVALVQLNEQRVTQHPVRRAECVLILGEYGIIKLTLMVGLQ